MCGVLNFVAKFSSPQLERLENLDKISMQCFFCSQNSRAVDYKEVELLKKFISGQGKIIDPKYTGICAKHQRMVSRAIKRARVMGLLSFTKR